MAPQINRSPLIKRKQDIRKIARGNYVDGRAGYVRDNFDFVYINYINFVWLCLNKRYICK